MTDNLDTYEAFVAYLADNSVVREAHDTGSAPPAYIMPQDGVPGPVPGADELVVGVFKVAGITPRPFEGFRRIDGVEIIVRAIDAKAAVQFEATVRSLVNDRREWDMRGVRVNQSYMNRDMQMLGSGVAGYTFNFQYMIERWS